MKMGERLTDSALDGRLATLNATGSGDWSVYDKGKLAKTFHFADFVQAFAFMTYCALVAERLNHHPEWFNVYATVRVALTTHDAHGITALDFELAREMDRAGSRL
jgi:4a-hydroxytetrahydrobiopterin dehydratase